MTTNKTGRITGTEMEEAISRFERDCRSDGVGETVRSFIREPLFIWMDALAQASDESVSHSEGEFHAECGLDRNMIMRTTVGSIGCCPFVTYFSFPPSLTNDTPTETFS
ncbi:hypothetical protein [Bifidobacterium pseudocatenulatum]|uniref:hypothetical protein n=1 Tax=Bifidobacterium pseudocatenulatum TaxID=28026 RepID=UPI00216B6335|nr:hypothetical protein [Bifidobacterium pseudocatenulatum]